MIVLQNLPSSLPGPADQQTTCSRSTASEEDALNQEDQVAAVTDESAICNVRPEDVAEHDGAVLLSIDLPAGVEEAEDVNLYENDGVIEIEAFQKDGDGDVVATFERKFAFDDGVAVSPAAVTAELSDGILTVAVPKKPEEKQIVPFLSDPPPKETTVEFFRIQIELPGVDREGLQLSVTDDRLFLAAEWKKGGSTDYVAKRSIAVDKKSIDVASMQAFLSKGLLTVLAPKLESSLGALPLVST